MSSFEQGSPLEKAKPDANLTDFDRKVAAALNNPTVLMLLLREFKDYLVQYLALNQPPVPIGQIVGFTQFTVQAAAQVLTDESTASESYTDLSTDGPTLTGLSDGSYLVLFGCSAKVDTLLGETARMSVEVNGTAASDDDMILTGTSFGTSIGRAVTKSLAAGSSNELSAKYRSTDSGTNASFANRWLLALKYANA